MIIFLEILGYMILGIIAGFCIVDSVKNQYLLNQVKRCHKKNQREVEELLILKKKK